MEEVVLLLTTIGVPKRSIAKPQKYDTSPVAFYPTGIKSTQLVFEPFELFNQLKKNK